MANTEVLYCRHEPVTSRFTAVEVAGQRYLVCERCRLAVVRLMAELTRPDRLTGMV